MYTVHSLFQQQGKLPLHCHQTVEHDHRCTDTNNIMPEIIYRSTWPGTNRIVPSWSYMWVPPLSWSSLQEILPLMLSVVACMCQYIILSTNKLDTKFKQLRTSLRFLKYIKESPVSRQNRFCTLFFSASEKGEGLLITWTSSPRRRFLGCLQLPCLCAEY